MSKVILPAPHPGQQAVRAESKRFNWLSAGRRWRKTTLVMAIAVEAALEGKKVIWGAPIYDQSRIAYEETRKAVGSIAKANISRMTWEFPTGGQIVFRSLDNPDNVRGHTADGVVIDEAADVAPIAWHEALRPMLIDTGGWAWIIGTPKGLNWFNAGFVDALNRADSAAWQAPTLGARIEEGCVTRVPHPMENPDIPWDEIVHLFETLPADTFKQEILAEFIQGSGAVFRNVDACCIHKPDQPQNHFGHITVAGIDWGQQHDFTVISIYCVTCNREVALDRFNQVGWGLQRTRLAHHLGAWKVKTAYVEANSIGGPNLEQLHKDIGDQHRIVGFEMTSKSKPEVVQGLALSLEKRSSEWLDDPTAKFELVAYEAKRTEAGYTKYSAPEGGFDDCVIARCLSNEAKRLNPIPLLTKEDRIYLALPAHARPDVMREKNENGSLAPADQLTYQYAHKQAVKKVEQESHSIIRKNARGENPFDANKWR